MPGSPTPVSGCLLRRLEVAQGLTTRAFTSTSLCEIGRTLSLTIEGERPIDSAHGSLTLLVHDGIQQMVRVDKLLWNFSWFSNLHAVALSSINRSFKTGGS